MWVRREGKGESQFPGVTEDRQQDRHRGKGFLTGGCYLRGDGGNQEAGAKPRQKSGGGKAAPLKAFTMGKKKNSGGSRQKGVSVQKATLKSASHRERLNAEPQPKTGGVSYWSRW